MNGGLQFTLCSTQYALLFLGVVGMMSLGLIPYRAWTLLRTRAKNYRRLAVSGKLIIIIPMIAFNIQISIKIYRCLMGQYCGPSVGSGWIYLGMLGAAYVVFEILRTQFL